MTHSNFKKKISLFVFIVINLLLLTSCKTKSEEKPQTKESIEKVSSSQNIKFTYQEITGIGKDSLYNRRDNSDVVKVGDTYYVWYSKMVSPTISGYWATIWYATSKDKGYTWQEQGMALDIGKEGGFDDHSVFTPNILEYHGKYYMYYTGVKPTPGNKKGEFENNSKNDITAIGLAVSNTPDGPFVRVKNNPVLTISDVAEDFDSYRIDDASLLVKEDKIWLYYKGRSIVHGNKGAHFTQMSVAIADSPEGPYVKQTKPLLDKSHEVLVWKTKEGISSLASINHRISTASDGLNFKPHYQNLKKVPKAPGLFRSSLSDTNSFDELPNWGIAMIQKKGVAYLLRFEITAE
ncbi:family 43 glycosylhydrolase [Polaribacter sp. 20A6]|uniref:family 43 glycosylhydrolase n=1 Tax=Polaribacter sp. 20A6 TaxID=2687289 RepID=UPI0013FE45CB|nr:family 43 glycosylhydrolase [Polaribacter sp. 20A6]